MGHDVDAQNNNNSEYVLSVYRLVGYNLCYGFVTIFLHIGLE